MTKARAEVPQSAGYTGGPIHGRRNRNANFRKRAKAIHRQATSNESRSEQACISTARRISPVRVTTSTGDPGTLIRTSGGDGIRTHRLHIANVLVTAF